MTPTATLPNAHLALDLYEQHQRGCSALLTADCPTCVRLLRVARQLAELTTQAARRPRLIERPEQEGIAADTNHTPEPALASTTGARARGGE